MTEIQIDGTRSKMGRDKLWTDRIVLPLAEGTTDRIKPLLVPGEFRLDFIRTAIEREIKRRGGQPPKPVAGVRPRK